MRERRMYVYESRICVCARVKIYVCKRRIYVCERRMYVYERRIYVCARVKIYVCERRMYVCERRMYVCERARMNYVLYGPSYLSLCSHLLTNLSIL